MQELRVTLTGADPSCDQDTLLGLAREYPFLELAFLYSRGREGVGRYPPAYWLMEMTHKLRAQHSQCAVHLCGEAVQEFIDGSQEMQRLVASANRVQINFNLEKRPVDLDRLDTVIRRWRRPVITQANQANQIVAARITAPNHELLFDASGGRGIAPREWPAPIPGKLCSYAGGIGPENIVSELDNIKGLVGAGLVSVDMEGKLRDELDQFSISRARSVAEQAAWWQNEQLVPGQVMV